MKKLIYSALALVAGLFATSCLQENLETVQGGSTVTFTVQVPEVTTKAVGDGMNVNKLVYAVYRAADAVLADPTQTTDEALKGYLANSAYADKFQLVYQEDQGLGVGSTGTIADKSTVVSLELINDQRYIVLFWAQQDETWVKKDNQGKWIEFKTITYPDPADYDANDDKYAAFSGVSVVSVDGSVSKNIVLTRPFAQVNIAASVPAANRYKNFDVTSSEVTINGIASGFNVATQKGLGKKKHTYAADGKLAQDYPVSEYPLYISMNYIFVEDNSSNVDVSYNITSEYGEGTKDHTTVSNTITNVPVAKNYKTNIVGNLLTSGVEYNVTLENWADAGKDMVVVNDGVVKNINGDYEVTNANGLAYAINNLFAQGGNFYLTAALYEMAGYDVNPPTVPQGKTLNVYGQTPVVTKSTATVPVAIKGLKTALIKEVIGQVLVKDVEIEKDGVEDEQVLIEKVAEGGKVLISGVKIKDEDTVAEGSVLVMKNEGTVVVEDSSAETLVKEGEVIKTTGITSVEELQAAINTIDSTINVEEIEIAGDIVGDVTVVQKQGVKITIDGNGKKYNGAIKVHSNSNHYADAALTIKNVNFETSVASLNFIEALENGAERYSTNITADNCTFTATGEAVKTAVGLQIKSSKNAQVLNCTATDMHSLIQAQSCDETVVVNGCTINGKNGVAFKAVKAATVEGTTITATGYGIRFDGDQTNYGITIKNNNVTAAQPFIVRRMTGTNNSITLEGTNTLTTEAEYQIVITKGEDDAEYVKPTGTYTLTGADGYTVYTGPLAKVGNTEYCSIDKAIENWTNNTTLTLLADVTLSDVVTLNSTEHHILDLSTYTMTAAEGKNAFVIKACGTGDSERNAITIKADVNNPGGINAGKKSVIYYKYADGGISGNDRPIIKIEGGVFTGSTSSIGTAGIYTIGTAARKCATLNISGGVFNCTINGSGKSKLLISGGIFHYSVGSQGDSTALRLISGGTFKTLGFMTADSNNTKFWFGTSMGNSNVGLYINDDNYLVVGGPVITEFGDKFAAKATNPTKWSSYLQYSSAAANGLYYTNAELAVKKHGEANVVLK